MVIKIVKIYLGLSLVLWAVWGHFQGGSLCLASSVCWSLQCLISALTQGGRWWTLFFFLGSLVQSRCGEGGMLQITLACARSVSATLGMPLHTAHTAQALGCFAGNPLRLALGCVRLPGLSGSGSGTQVVFRGADSVGSVFVPFPGPSSSGVWRARSLRLTAFPVPAAQFSGCTTGAPSQSDGDCLEPQEVLVSKEACLQFGS